MKLVCISDTHSLHRRIPDIIETGRFGWLVGQRQCGCFYRNTFVRSVFPTTQTKKVTKLTAQNLGRRGLVTPPALHQSSVEFP